MAIKDAFGSLVNKAKTGTNIVVTGTKKLSNEASKRMEMSSIEGNLKQAYCELGKVVYANVSGEDENHTDPTPYLEKIKEIKDKYDAVKAEFEESDKNYEDNREEQKRNLNGNDTEE